MRMDVSSAKERKRSTRRNSGQAAVLSYASELTGNSFTA